MSGTDLELLARYTRQHAEDAFAEIVRRHLNLVYSAALRQVRSPQLAEEVVQSVFVALARQASHLAADTILPAWLYQVTRHTAIDVIRRETRRQLREQFAQELNTMNATVADWTQIEPLLDEAMHALDASDRTAILLRYFENKSFREVGETFGTTEDTARKRVNRAVERLREFFARRGATVGAGGLAVLLSANAVQAAPVGLAATVLTTTLVGTTLTATAFKVITMTTLQKALLTTTLLAAVSTGVYEASQASAARARAQQLEQRQASLAEQIQRLTRERDAAASQLAFLREDKERTPREVAELLKLRGETALLRNEINDPTQKAVKSWFNRVALLKQRLAQTPEANIPELKLLEEEDWLAAVKSRRLDSDADFRRALSTLRVSAESKVASNLNVALQKYMKENGSRFPAGLTLLQPYFDLPIGDDTLQRWEIVPASEVKNVVMGGKMIITQKAPVDDVFDSRMVIGPNGFGSTDFLYPAIAGDMDAIRNAYKAANQGQDSENISQLLPYATTATQQIALQKLLLRDAGSR